MPLMWVYSTVVLILVLMVMIIMYFYQNKYIFIDKDSMINVNMYTLKW